VHVEINDTGSNRSPVELSKCIVEANI